MYSVKGQKDKRTKGQKDKMTKGQLDKRTKGKHYFTTKVLKCLWSIVLHLMDVYILVCFAYSCTKLRNQGSKTKQKLKQIGP